MLEEVIGGLFGGAVGGSTSQRLERRKARKLRENSQLECAVRDVLGVQPQLSSKWFRGVAWISDHRIVLDHVDLPVSSIYTNSARNPTAREAWTINPELTIVKVMNQHGQFELALHEEDLAWLCDHLVGRCEAE
jgi:hypothetical protein